MADCLSGLQTDLVSDLDPTNLTLDIRAYVESRLGRGISTSPDVLKHFRDPSFFADLRAWSTDLDNAIGSPGLSPGSKALLARERSKVRLLRDVAEEFQLAQKAGRPLTIRKEWREKFANPRFFGKSFPVDTSKIMDLIDEDLAKPPVKVFKFPNKRNSRTPSFDADTEQIHRIIKILERDPGTSVAPLLRRTTFRAFDYQEWLKGYPDTGGGTKQRLLRALKEVAGPERTPDVTPPILKPVPKPPVRPPVEPAPPLLPPLRFPEIEIIADRHDFRDRLDEMTPERKTYNDLTEDAQRLRYEEQWEGKGVFADDEYKQAWLDYTRSDYIPINQGMRRGEWADPKYRTVADKLQEAIDSSRPLPVKRVYRGQDDDTVGPNLKPGDRFRDDGFVSTTDDFATGRDFAGRMGSPTTFQHKTLYIIEPNEAMRKRGVVAGNQSESEWILPPGSTFKVGNITEFQTAGGGKHRIIHLEWDGVEAKPKKRIRPESSTDYGQLKEELPELQDDIKASRRVMSGTHMSKRDAFDATYRVEAPGREFLDKITGTGRRIDREVKARVRKSLETDPPIDFDYEIEFAAIAKLEAKTALLGMTPGTEDYYRAKDAVTDAERAHKRLVEDKARDRRNRERQAYLAVMTELRGELAQGAEIRFAGSVTPASQGLRKGLRLASQMFPKDWMSAVGRRFPNLVAKKSGRGFFATSHGKARQPTISVSPRVGIHSRSSGVVSNGEEFFEVGVHELGHAVEESVEGVKLAEHLFYWYRTGQARTVKLHGEAGRPDRFFEQYVGRDYGGNPNDPYEILSMMAEWRMGGMKYNLVDPDEEMLYWLYGVMALF